MKKVTLIKEDQFFKESEKVIHLVNEREDHLQRSLPIDRKLQIAKDSLVKTRSREEYEKINELIKELEYEMKFGKDYIPAIPEEHQLRIAYNRVHEEEQLDAEITKQKELLSQILDGLEPSLVNVLTNLEALEKRKLIGKKIDILLDGKIQKDSRFESATWHATYLSFSGDQHNTKVALEKGKALFRALRDISIKPVTPSGIEKPSIFQKLLGGNK